MIQTTERKGASMKHRTTVFLNEDQVKKMAEISKKTGAPMAEIVRRAIDAYLKNWKGATL